jgi:hypothetical protein
MTLAVLAFDMPEPRDWSTPPEQRLERIRTGGRGNRC